VRGALLLNQVGQAQVVEDNDFFVRLRVQPLEIVLKYYVFALIVAGQRIRCRYPAEFRLRQSCPTNRFLLTTLDRAD